MHVETWFRMQELGVAIKNIMSEELEENQERSTLHAGILTTDVL